jgi:hypothetical protein
MKSSAWSCVLYPPASQIGDYAVTREDYSVWSCCCHAFRCFSGDQQTSIEIYDLDGRQLLPKLWESKISLAEVDAVDWVGGMVAVCFDNRTTITVNTFDLVENGSSSVDATPASISTVEGKAAFAALFDRHLGN